MVLKYHTCYTVLKQVVVGKRQATLINYRGSKMAAQSLTLYKVDKSN